MDTPRWHRDTSLLLLSLSVDHMLNATVVGDPINDSLPRLSSHSFPSNEATPSHKKSKDCGAWELRASTFSRNTLFEQS